MSDQEVNELDDLLGDEEESPASSLRPKAASAPTDSAVAKALSQLANALVHNNNTIVDKLATVVPYRPAEAPAAKSVAGKPPSEVSFDFTRNEKGQIYGGTAKSGNTQWHLQVLYDSKNRCHLKVTPA